MHWNSPAAKRHFIRSTDEIVALAHRDTSIYRSEVVHVPRHVMEQLRPDIYPYRLDILFSKTKVVEVPKYLADYLLDRYPSIYVSTDKQLFENLESLQLFALQALSKRYGIFRYSITKKEMLERLNEIKDYTNRDTKKD
jgi:hypothetical protein